MKPTNAPKPWHADVTVAAYGDAVEQIGERFHTFKCWYEDQCALLQHTGAVATGLWGASPAVRTYLETEGLRGTIEHDPAALVARMASMPEFPPVWPDKFAGEYLAAVRLRMDQMDGFMAPDYPSRAAARLAVRGARDQAIALLRAAQELEDDLDEGGDA